MLCGLRNNDPKNYAPIEVENEVEPKKDAKNNDNMTVEYKNNNNAEENTNTVEISNRSTSSTNDSKEEKKEPAAEEKVIIRKIYNMRLYMTDF